MKIEAALVGVTRLYLDTAPVIYLVERNPQFFNQVQNLTLDKTFTDQLSVADQAVTPPCRSNSTFTQLLFDYRSC